MGLFGKGVAINSVTALMVVGGYIWADINDQVPGIFTNQPAPSVRTTVNPTAPGAGLGPEIEPYFSTLNTQAAIPREAKLKPFIAQLASDERIGPSLGVAITDAVSGKMLASYDAQSPKVPASTQKTLTAIAALYSLEPDSTISTQVQLNDKNQLVLIGNGDMLLSAQYGDVNAVNGRAGLADLALATAKELKAKGVLEVSLSFDDTLFKGNGYEVWKVEQVDAGHVAPVAALGVDMGRKAEGSYAPRYRDPALVAAQTFSQRLNEQGITVIGEVSRGNKTTTGLNLASVESAPMRDLVAYLLQTSDNTLTEIMGRKVALVNGFPATFNGATQAVLSELVKFGLNTQGIVLVDCSGLAEGSAVSAAKLNEALQLAFDSQNFDLRQTLVSLPIAGVQGSLHDRFLTQGSGIVRGKTGSLPGVTALSGSVFTADRRLLLFTVIADKTPGAGQFDARTAIDEFVLNLVDCGC